MIFLGQVNGPLEEEMGGMKVCHKLCLGVVSTSSLLLCGKSQSSLADETPRKGSMTIDFPLEDLSSGR